MTIHILAIETATDACSVALLRDDVLIHRYEHLPQQHAHSILPMVDSVLTEAEIPLAAVDALSFGRGPGSFTGLRIAASVVQGFSLGIQKPIIPISSLRALAQKMYRERGATHVLASLDARMHEQYWGLFVVDHQGIMQAYSEERLGSETEMLLSEAKWSRALGLPEAQDVVVLARAEYDLGNVVSAEDAIPVYVRDKVVR